jgi:hypothetical protein
MHSDSEIAVGSKKMVWAGRIVSAIAVLFLIFDAVVKVWKMAVAVDATAQLGYPANFVLGIGVLELVCLVLYLIPRTSILGAILMTGYLGGAIASQLRAGNPLFSNVLFPVYVGLLIWGGLYFRDTRLRALIPLRKK